MKLNDNFKLLMSINNYNNLTGNKSTHSNTKALNKHYNNHSKSSYFQNKRDSVFISNTAQQLSLNYEKIISMKRVNDEETNLLKSKDNILEFKKGTYYNFQSSNGEKMILTTDEYGHVTMPFIELGISSDSIATSHLKEIDRIEKFFTYLSRDSTALLVNLSYKENEAKDILSRVGIEPGFFKIKNGSKTNEFYLLENGKIYSKHQSEGHRHAFNTSNFFKEGYTKDSLFIIDGKEFKLNDDGYLNIPEGTACLTETIKIFK
ncbi:hypothetical protein EUAN_04240 [Andreesenia angusta]|uniref:Cyclic nucleotide-binding domain-containing protein n=1 Tax=Andreesenia angusta TaxID=39480 RepID=A0A1S1VAN2_9FIRM|nr:hypothetical protein [Andreesenia angusta]OHW63560.1 hypothetical protein EUAN_04240 [Andreesenia angusta]